jgi:hypothetical protein
MYFWYLSVQNKIKTLQRIAPKTTERTQNDSYAIKKKKGLQSQLDRDKHSVPSYRLAHSHYIMRKHWLHHLLDAVISVLPFLIAEKVTRIFNYVFQV